MDRPTDPAGDERDARGERGGYATKQRESVSKLHGLEWNLHHQETHDGRHAEDGDHAVSQRCVRPERVSNVRGLEGDAGDEEDDHDAARLCD